jgi:serine/threonine-protein kinase
MTDTPIPAVLKHYALGRRIGSGGMGTVFEAADRRDGSRVAVKLLHPELANADVSFRERFQREAHLAALLRSPYTVQLLDYGFEQGYLFMVMEYVEGASLDQLIERGPLPPLVAARIAHDVARALEEAEARGVVHRDIKPANILIGLDDSVKVADFGVARQPGQQTLTGPGAFVGTVAFAAPEQFRGQADTRTDIYSLGATLYTMLTGRPPRSRAGDRMPELDAVPGPLQTVVRRCLELDPEDRYQSATELAAALTRASAALRAAESRTAAPAPTAVFPPASPGPQAAPATGMPGEAPTIVAPVAPDDATVVTAAPLAGVAGTAPLRVALLPRGWADLRKTVAVFELTAENLAPTRADLRFEVDAPGCEVTIPAALSVPPGGSSRVAVRVRAIRRRRFGGTEARPVRVTATAAGGAIPPASASATFTDEPDGRARNILLGAGAGVVALAAVGGLALAGGLGGGSSPPAADASPTRTATGPSPTSRPAVEPTAGPTGTPTPEPADSIVAGEWTYNFVVQSNSCGNSPAPGQRFEVRYYFDEAREPRDGYLSPGELAGVTFVGSNFLGNFVFSWPQFTFSYPISGGTAVVGNTFTSSTTGIASLTETYPVGNSTCSVYFVDQ